MDSYRTIGRPATAELTIERSRFIGHCLETADEPAAKAFIAKIRAEHAQANHNCYAYRIGLIPHPLEYFNDHGEPAGTAGKPILGAIQRLDLLNVVVVVTRYFGGRKLGVRGLIEAYGQAATQVLEAAGPTLRIVTFDTTLIYHYSDHSLILHRLKQVDAETLDIAYTDRITAVFRIPEAKRADYLSLISELPAEPLT